MFGVRGKFRCVVVIVIIVDLSNDLNIHSVSPIKFVPHRNNSLHHRTVCDVRIMYSSVSTVCL